MDRVLAATLIYNTPDLAECMREQLPQVVLVENGSTEVFSGLTGQVVWLSERRSFTQAWNYVSTLLTDPGIEYLWQLNSDLCWLSEHSQNLLAHFLDTHPEYMAVTPAFNSPHREFQVGQKGIREVRWIDWTGPMVRLSDWEELGGFDETFLGYGADIDLAYRARQKGKRFAVLGDIEMLHLGSLTAQRHAMIGIQNNYAEMERCLLEKWGKHWQEMV